MSKNDTNPIAGLLRDAAALIDSEGWHQGDFGSPTDGWCAIGAIQQAADGNGTLTADAIKAVAETTNGSDALTRIAAWNDHPNRTAAEVIDGLRQTAATLTN